MSSIEELAHTGLCSAVRSFSHSPSSTGSIDAVKSNGSAVVESRSQQGPTPVRCHVGHWKGRVYRHSDPPPRTNDVFAMASGGPKHHKPRAFWLCSPRIEAYIGVLIESARGRTGRTDHSFPWLFSPNSTGYLSKKEQMINRPCRARIVEVVESRGHAGSNPGNKGKVRRDAITNWTRFGGLGIAVLLGYTPGLGPDINGLWAWESDLAPGQERSSFVKGIMRLLGVI